MLNAVLISLALGGCATDVESPGLVHPPAEVPCVDYTSQFAGWKSAPLSAPAKFLALHDGFAIVADDQNNILSFSVDELGNLLPTDSLRVDSPILDLTVGRDHVIAALGESGIHVLELLSDGNLVDLGSWNEGPAVWEVAAEASLVLLLGGGQLRLVQLSIGSAPQVVDQRAVPGNSSDLQYQHPIVSAYLPDSSEHRCFDVRRLSEPDYSASATGPVKFVLGKNYGVHVYCPPGPYWLGLTQIEEPLNLLLLEQRSLYLCQTSWQYDGGYFYYDDYGAILEFEPRSVTGWRPNSITTVENPSSLTRFRSRMVFQADATLRSAVLDNPHDSPALGVWPHHAGLDWILFRGSIAFGMAANWGLAAVDTSDPHNLRELGRVRADGGSRGLALKGRYVYFANQDRLVTVDAQDPTSMVWLGSVELLGRGIDVCGTSSHLYVDVEGAMSVFDIKDPRNPVWVRDVMPTPLIESMMLVEESMLVVVTSADGGGVQVYDLTDPTNPRPLSVQDFPHGKVRDVAVDPSRGLMFSVGPDELAVYSMPTSDSLQLLRAYPEVSGGWQCVFDESVLYVVDSFGVLTAFDVADYQSIHSLGSYRTKAIGSLASDGRMLYITQWHDGMRAFAPACR